MAYHGRRGGRWHGGSAAAAYVTNKFVQEPEFRAWLRGDYAYAAKVVEETLPSRVRARKMEPASAH